MIQVEPKGEVSIIRLDRADKRNALTPKMLANLCGAIDRAMSAKAIVLSGVGEVFCAGFDLTLCREDDAVLGDLLTGLSRAVRAIRQAPCPVIASAHGAAIAGGCALAAACDIVVASIHNALRQDRAKITNRLLKAMENPHVTIMGHPTARLINKREPMDVDMEAKTATVTVKPGYTLSKEACDKAFEGTKYSVKTFESAGST